MDKAILSKSTYIKGDQCLKYLYLYKKHYNWRDPMPPERVATFTRGTKVGEIAQQLFPDGVNCKIGGPRNYQKSVDLTQACLQNNTPVLYEAAFVALNTLVYLDILVLKEDGYHAFEVKSSLKISETYLKDAALQSFVIKKSGLKLKSFSLIYTNAEYVRIGDLNLEELFVVEDVSMQISDLELDIEKGIETQLQVLSENSVPDIPIGIHCRKPYDCDFLNHCWKSRLYSTAFSLPSLSFEQQFEIFNNSMEISDLASHFSDISISTLNEVKAKMSGSVHVSTEFKQKLEDVSNEIGYLKIFAFQPAIPILNNTKPYQRQIYGYAIKSSGNEIIVKFASSKENLESIEKEIESIVSQYNLITFDVVDERLFQGFESRLLSYKTEIMAGQFCHPDITDYKFSTVFKAVTGKSAWFSKILIDQQAALIFEEVLTQPSNADEQMNWLSRYAAECLKYLEALHHKILKISNI